MIIYEVTSETLGTTKERFLYSDYDDADKKYNKMIEKYEKHLALYNEKPNFNNHQGPNYKFCSDNGGFAVDVAFIATLKHVPVL